MSGKFIHTSNLYYIFKKIFYTIMLMLMLFIPFGYFFDYNIVLDLYEIFTIVGIVVLICSSVCFKINAFFKADEKQINFKILLKNITLNYDDIKEINTEKKYKFLTYGNNYQIKLKIKTINKTYTFTDLVKPNMVDMPDCSDLLRLCGYIENFRKKC